MELYCYWFESFNKNDYFKPYLFILEKEVKMKTVFVSEKTERDVTVVPNRGATEHMVIDERAQYFT
jgi:hypothetical protein